jgi:putative transposase
MTKIAYKFRFYPTEEQQQLLAKTFGCVRYVYNFRILEEQRNFLDFLKSLK